MMDQNLGRVEMFEVDPPPYDPYPDPNSHLRRQLRITGDTLLLRSPGIALTGFDRQIGCQWYQKNIENATLPGNVYASVLECSLHEIDEARRAVAKFYKQVQKFGLEAVPRIYSLLIDPSKKKAAIAEFLAFLKNLQYNLRVLDQTIPGQNSDTKIITIIAEDPISRTHHCLFARQLLSLSEVILSGKCPQVAHENFHLLLEFGDDILRIAFLLQRFTYDVQPAIASAIVKYNDRTGKESECNIMSYDEIHLTGGQFIPYFRIGMKTDASIVNQGLIRLRRFIMTDLKFCPEQMLDLIDEGMIVAANSLILQHLVTIDNLVGLWFCKQYNCKQQLAISHPLEVGPQIIEELADIVYRYNDANARYDRVRRFDKIKLLQNDMCAILRRMLQALTKTREGAKNASDHPAIGVNRKNVIRFLTRVFSQLIAVVQNPIQFANENHGPFDALYKEQDAYMNRIVYKRLEIFSSKKALPLVLPKLYIDACKLTTKKPDLDRLMCLERWPTENVIRYEEK